jgi:hypothetical protein
MQPAPAHHRAIPVAINPPGFPAQEQRFALVFPGMKGADNNIAAMLFTVTLQ